MSIGSVTSIASIGSVNCVLGWFRVCDEPKYKEHDGSFVIRIDEGVWEIMASCRKEEYKSDDRPEKCDYQTARLSYKLPSQAIEMNEQIVEIRRKGSSTWTYLHDKPSFKIKFEESQNFGTYSCGSHYCPTDQDENIWKSKKLTLNNMRRTSPLMFPSEGEIDAYDVFDDYMATPLALSVNVDVYKGSKFMYSGSYVMVETISDKAFMKKHFGDDYALWEVEAGRVEFKRDGGNIDGEEIDIDILNMNIDKMNETNMLYYYAGELTTGHWDGGCLRSQKNNYYVAFDGEMYYNIPSGLDHTYDRCNYDLNVGSPPHCTPMKICFEKDECKDKFETVLDRVETNADRKMLACDGYIYFVVIICASTFTSLTIAFVCFQIKK